LVPKREPDHFSSRRYSAVLVPCFFSSFSLFFYRSSLLDLALFILRFQKVFSDLDRGKRDGHFDVNNFSKKSQYCSGTAALWPTTVPEELRWPSLFLLRRAGSKWEKRASLSKFSLCYFC